MKAICLNFQVHQPYRLRTYRFFDIGESHHYYDDFLNRTTIRRVAELSYVPANKLFLELIKKYGSQFKLSFSISGLALEQMDRWAPDALEGFQKLANTGSVEFLSETFPHSLSSLRSKDAFTYQIEKHRKAIQHYFGQNPLSFSNTEMIYSDQIGEWVAELGYTTMLTEGAKHILGWKSPNYLYCNAINPKLKLLLRNFQLSDDLAFRFSNKEWSQWPVTAEKFTGWLNALPKEQEVVNLFMDYPALGERQPAESGIFDFLRALPGMVIQTTPFRFHTPSEASQMLQPISAIHVPFPVSWADEERDVTTWLGNELQQEASGKLFEMAERVRACQDEGIQRDWSYLQASDHLYYMSTKWFSDVAVHRFFNPYASPYEAFINYMNVLSDFEARLDSHVVPLRTQTPTTPTPNPTPVQIPIPSPATPTKKTRPASSKAGVSKTRKKAGK